MYATKRRRRSLKSNNKALPQPHKGHDGPNAPVGSTKSNPSKRHRERLNTELERLASLLPFESNILSKLDKLSILRLSASFLRIKSYFQAIEHHGLAFHSPYDAPAGISHQHVTKANAFEHFPFDPSLLRTESMLKALNGFVLVLTRDGDVFYASGNVEEFLGFHQSDVIHQKVTELIHSEDRHELEKQLSYGGSTQRGNLDSADPFNNLERCITLRFRCLLDNTSGFLRFEVRGRMGVLHGQNLPGGEVQLALLAICTPFGPPALIDTVSRDSMFKSKHKLDLTLINLDPKGKNLLGYEDEISPCRQFYNWVHPEDLHYAVSAHKELKNTSSCGLLAYRVMTKTHQWQWLQTSMRIIFKSGKSDHVTATHRPLTEEEGRELLTKRSSVTKLDELDDQDKLFPKDEPLSYPKAPKSKKRSSPTTREYPPYAPSTLSTRKSKFGPTDGYGSGSYPDASSLSGSLAYCATPYSAPGVLDPSRLFSGESFIPYPQFGANCYTPLAETLPQASMSTMSSGAPSLDVASSRPYDFYGYTDSQSASGDYFKSYYKGVKMFLPTMDSAVPRLTTSYSSYSTDSSASQYGRASSAWIPHHRKSVVVWNGLTSGYSRPCDETENSYGSSASNLTGHRMAQDENEAQIKLAGVEKPSQHNAANFSISEATNTILS